MLEVSMSVKVREKRGKLYLDIYQKGKRTWESLHLSLTKDKAQNREVLRLAEVCRSQRETQLLAGAWNIQDPVAARKKFIPYLEERARDYANPSSMRSFIYHVKKFGGSETVFISQITSQWVSGFYEYL
jgi:hypothetical protein